MSISRQEEAAGEVSLDALAVRLLAEKYRVRGVIVDPSGPYTLEVGECPGCQRTLFLTVPEGDVATCWVCKGELRRVA